MHTERSEERGDAPCMDSFHFQTFKNAKMVPDGLIELEGPSVRSRMDSAQSAELFLIRHGDADVQLPVKK